MQALGLPPSFGHLYASPGQLLAFVLIVAALLALGFGAAALMFYYPILSLSVGALFYLLQSVAYLGPTHGWAFRAGINVSVSFRSDEGVVVLNVLSIALALAQVIASLRRSARSNASSSAADRSGT